MAVIVFCCGFFIVLLGTIKVFWTSIHHTKTVTYPGMTADDKQRFEIVHELCAVEEVAFQHPDNVWELIGKASSIKARIARMSIRQGWFKPPGDSNVISMDRFKQANSA